MVPKGLRMDGGSTRSIQPQDTARVLTPPYASACLWWRLRTLLAGAVQL